jgi:arylsulfatase
MMSWDSVRADHMPFHGYDRDTAPALGRMADDGLVFERAYVSGVGTPTSFSGVLTGEHAHGAQTNITPAHWRESNEGRRMLQEALQDAGYHTGGFHANALMSRFYGWDRGWDEFEDHLWTETENSGSPNDDSTIWDGLREGSPWTALKKGVLHPILQDLNVASEAIHAKNLVLGKKAYAPWESLWPGVERFVRGAPEPWFLWVLLVDTHHPWCAPVEFREWDQPGLRTMHAYNYAMRRFPRRMGSRNQSIVNAYDNELRHADAFLEKLDLTLAKEGYDPAFIMMSDHGDELGEHGDYGHAPAMWDTVARVPLVMRNVGEAGRKPGPWSLLDLGSTVLDIAGSDERLGGRESMLGRESDGQAHIENRTMRGDALRATVVGQNKLVDLPGRRLEYYDLADDPFEQEPREPGDALVREHLRASRPGPSSMAGSGGGVSDEVNERLANLGYR